MSYLNIKFWSNIVCLNKEVHTKCKSDLHRARALFVLKPYILRLKACYQVRRQFVNRLKTDVGFRNKYLFIHECEDKPTHVCWRKVPPACLSVYDGLENCQRLLSGEIEQLTKILENFPVEQYEWLLQNVRIIEGKVKISV